jgi:Leucine-rich repeat (LRR) protein
VHPFGKEITLAKVYLDYNKIEKLTAAPDGYFCGYSQLESFSATHNEMTEFPNIFNAKSVYVMQSVDFSYNKISSFEDDDKFKGINSSAVNITHNNLETFPGILFEKGSPMNQLILAGNGMKEIPEGSLKGEKTYLLEALDLSNNYLSELPDDFYARTLPYLYGLDLSYNRFSSFPTKPLSISTLNRFFIRYQRDEKGNRILKEWPTGLYTCPSMAIFLIGGNDLRKIEDTISPYIMYFEIADNPNISIDLSSVCDYIYAGYYTLIYDKTQDIRGCDALDLEK